MPINGSLNLYNGNIKEINWDLTPKRIAFKKRILKENNNNWPMNRLGIKI